jgi:cutinase
MTRTRNGTARGLRRALATVLGVAGVLATTLTLTPSASAQACSDVELVVARGTGEPGTLGVIVGDPVLSAVRQQLPLQNVGSYPVDYPASAEEGSARAGVLDLVEHVSAEAASCPDQKFVLVGYSQGASVVGQSLGLPPRDGGDPPAVIPANLSGRIAAVLMFGNPYKAQGVANPAPYDAVTLDVCRDGDPVCDPDGGNILAHLFYFLDAGTAGEYVAGRV